MIRVQSRCEVLYGHFADYMKSVEALNAVARDRGWGEATPWVAFGGKANEVVHSCDYPDYATFKQEDDASYADPEFRQAMKNMMQFVVQGSAVWEVLEAPPTLSQ